MPIDINSTTTEVRKLSATDIFTNSGTVAGSSGNKTKSSPLHKTVLQYAAQFPNVSSEDLNTDLLDADATSQTAKVLDKSTSNTTVSSNKVAEIRNIYFQKDFISQEIKTGISLLEKSQDLISKSIQSFREGKRKDSDEFVMQFKGFIPELFCCRTISESFGAVINSVGSALSNMKGTPLSERQLEALSTILTALMREPAMPFMKAVTYISEFENADFEVESPGLNSLLKLVEMMNNPEIESLND